MDPIVDPLAALNPLLGVIAAITTAVVGYLALQLRDARRRTESVQDREMQTLQRVVGVLHSVENNLQRSVDRGETDSLFQQRTTQSLGDIHEATREITSRLDRIRDEISRS